MIGKISNYSPSFKGATFKRPYVKTFDDDGNAHDMQLKSASKMKRLEKIAKEVDNLSEKLNVDVSGEIYIDTEYEPEKHENITLDYHIQNKGDNKGKSLVIINRIDVNESNKILMKQIKNSIVHYKKYC